MLRMNSRVDDGTTHTGEKAAPAPIPLLVVLAPAAAAATLLLPLAAPPPLPLLVVLAPATAGEGEAERASCSTTRSMLYLRPSWQCR